MWKRFFRNKLIEIVNGIYSMAHTTVTLITNKFIIFSLGAICSISTIFFLITPSHNPDVVGDLVAKIGVSFIVGLFITLVSYIVGTYFIQWIKHNIKLAKDGMDVKPFWNKGD